MEEAIHVGFNDTKPDIEILELDESFADIRLDEGIGPLTEQSIGKEASNQITKQQEEEREPTGQILRKNHPESQIIGDPSTKVQTRRSHRQQGYIALISEVEPKQLHFFHLSI